MNWQLLNKMLGMEMPEEAKQMNQMDQELAVQSIPTDLLNQKSMSDEELKARLLREIQEKLNQEPKYQAPTKVLPGGGLIRG